jgi:hypothetical protein
MNSKKKIAKKLPTAKKNTKDKKLAAKDHSYNF